MNFNIDMPPIQSESPIALTDTGISLAEGATVSLRNRSIADSCHLIGQAVSLPTARIGQEKVTVIPNVLISRDFFLGMGQSCRRLFSEYKRKKQKERYIPKRDVHSSSLSSKLHQ
ncbi:hypothetical protein TNCV_1395891 [Trichonephila clavipes]|nr:hypothetical protein TNCV_1395891 [Trichonephila clavipes]